MAGNELTFEANFAQLVFSQLSEKCPAILKYYKGFQLVDKADDESRAFGVAAVATDKVFLYVPSFFIQGKVRGLDMLYIYQKDLFAPNTDNQINVLVQDGGAAYGNAAGRKPGFNSAMAASTYDFRRGLFKGASHLSDANALIEESCVQKMASTEPTTPLTLSEGLAGLGKQAACAFLQTMADRPDFMNALLGVYEPEDLHKLASELVKVTEFTVTKDKDPRSDIQFITDTKEPEARKLTTEQKKLLLQNGIYILDNRKQFSEVYRDKLNTGNLSNPTQPGIYDLLDIKGEFKRFAVLREETIEGDNDCCVTNNRRPLRKFVLIDMTKDEVAGVFPAEKLFGKPAIDADLKEGLRLDRLPELTARTVLSPGYYEILADGQTAYRLYVGTSDSFHVGTEKTKISAVSVNDPVYHREVMVPKGARYLQVLPVSTRSPDAGDKQVRDTVQDYFIPGTPELFQHSMLKLASEQVLVALDVVAKDSKFSLKTASINLQGLRKTAALKHLMYNMGVGMSDAYAVLADAGSVKGQRRSFLLKLAADYEKSSQLESLRMPEVEAQHEEQEGVKPYVMADDAIDAVTKASQGGIREVFDAKVLQRLLDVADPAEVRRDYIAKLIRSMDATGRLLFQYYWNLDEFIEQYGDQEAAELENKLRQLFRETGDLALFLREKTSDFEVMGDVEQDMSQDIATAQETTSE